jgi:hypothetical protein
MEVEQEIAKLAANQMGNLMASGWVRALRRDGWCGLDR